MKKIVFGLLVLLLLTFSFVTAAESYDVDFSQASTIPVYLHKGDEIRFSMAGGQQILLLNDVGKTSVKIGLVPFADVENNTHKVYETILGFDYILKLDLDKDGTPDVNVALYSISDDGEVHLVLQDAKAEAAAETASTGDVGLVDQSSGSLWSTKTISLVVIGVLIAGLILFLIFKNGKKGNSKDKKDIPSEVKIQEAASELQKDSSS